MHAFRVLFMLCLLWGLNSHAASFNCAKAVGQVETLICDDSELSALDEVLARTYKVALSVSVNSENLQKEQKQWLSVTRKRCTNFDCLKHAYEQRISRLETIWAESNIALNRALSDRRESSEKPFEGQWRNCQLWEGNEICSSYTLLQSGKHVCGEWEYWATNRTYSGQILAMAQSQSRAESRWICGTVGSETGTECRSEYEPNGGWEEAHGQFAICNSKLYQSEVGALCDKVPKSDGYMRWPLEGNSRRALADKPWMKSCLNSGTPRN